MALAKGETLAVRRSFAYQSHPADHKAEVFIERRLARVSW